jgi:transposase
MKDTSTAQLNSILSLLDSGYTGYQISSKTGLSTSTISRIRSKHCSSLPKASGGRPLKLSENDLRYATRLIGTGKAENAVQIAKSLQELTNQSLSAQTVRNRMKEMGMKAVVKKKRPLLSQKHRRARLDFAVAHRDWTLEDWKKVVWSDETKINCLGSDGRKWVWKKAGEGLSDRLVEGSLKFGGGSLMMWGCMLWEGVGYGCKIDGRMDAELYTQILEEDLQQSLEEYGKKVTDIIFQQDNDPKHKSRMATNWFQDHKYTVMDWPAQSPDLNPIEHLWVHLKKKLAEYPEPPKGILELWERAEAEWNKIDKEVCQKLIESMPRRIEAVLKAKGGYTKY